ncbi:MAG: hypothetical protein GY898_21710 [Proteobacteria bacterium]|nr:hypothetical protein [Pseudomonadota bacterium]
MSTHYDPQVIKDHADHLYLEATRAPVLYCVASAVIGITAGLGFGLGLDSAPAGAVIGTVLGLISGWVGFSTGRSVGARMKLSAQQALCQVAIERRLGDLNDRPA